MKKQKRKLVVKGYPKLTIDTSVDYKFAVVTTNTYPRERLDLLAKNGAPFAVKGAEFEVKEGQTESNFSASRTERSAQKELEGAGFYHELYGETLDMVLSNGWVTREVLPLETITK